MSAKQLQLLFEGSDMVIHLSDYLACPLKCHTVVRDVLSWGFVLRISYFLLKMNSPLVSGYSPFLLCHRSDISPDCTGVLMSVTNRSLCG